MKRATLILFATIAALCLWGCSTTSETVGSGEGAYVVVEHSYLDDGKWTTGENEIGEHGDILATNYSTPGFEPRTYTYKYDQRGNELECRTEDYSYKRTIDEVDGYGQPTKITETNRDGEKQIYEITWYGEGQVKEVVIKYPNWDSTGILAFSASGEITCNTATSNTTMGFITYSISSTYERNSEGMVVRETKKDSNGDVTTIEYEYDSAGNVVRILEGEIITDEYEYVYIEDVSPAVAAKSNHFLGIMGF